MSNIILSAPKFSTAANTSETKTYIFPANVKKLINISTRYYNGVTQENVDFAIFEESTQKKFIEGNTFAIPITGWDINLPIIQGANYSIQITNKNGSAALVSWALFFKCEV